MSPSLLLLLLRLTAAAALLAFLAVILIHLRRDLAAGSVESPTPPPVFLVGTIGGVQQRYPLRRVELVGRAADNTLVLKDETISAHHARLSYMGGHQWWLEDLGSRNGTSVNGLALEEALAVTTGDEISFGRVSLRIVEGASEAG